MINRYRRRARTAESLNLGDLAPLNQAIPEFNNGPSPAAIAHQNTVRVGSNMGSNLESLPQVPVMIARPEGFEPPTCGFEERPRGDVKGREQHETRLVVNQEAAPNDTAAHPEMHKVGSDLDVDRALSIAVQLAAHAGQWDVVALLGRELGERRRAQIAPAVVSLESARAKRQG